MLWMIQVSVKLPGERSYGKLTREMTTPYVSESDDDCKPGIKTKYVECGRQCADGVDNDGDGLSDCKDPNCEILCKDTEQFTQDSVAHACYKSCNYAGCGVKGFLKSWCNQVWCCSFAASIGKPS